MTKIKKFTQEEITLARSRGFRRKRPKKPRRRTLGNLEAYVRRMNAFVDAARAVNARMEKRKSDREKARKLRESIENQLRSV